MSCPRFCASEAPRPANWADPRSTLPPAEPTATHTIDLRQARLGDLIGSGRARCPAPRLSSLPSLRHLSKSLSTRHVTWKLTYVRKCAKRFAAARGPTVADIRKTPFGERPRFREGRPRMRTAAR